MRLMFWGTASFVLIGLLYVMAQSDDEQKVGRYATAQSWARAGGWRAAAYGRSLGTVMAFFFFLSLAAQSSPDRRPTTPS